MFGFGVADLVGVMLGAIVAYAVGVAARVIAAAASDPPE